MKPIHLITIILLFLQSCGVSRETIRYELPPKQAGDDPAKLQTILAFKTKDAEKLFDKDDSLLEGKEDELKKIAGKESSNPIVLKALARIDGKLTNLDKAKAIYEKAGLTNNSHYAWVLHDYGDYYKGNRDYLKAEEYYDNAIKIFEGLGELGSLSHLLYDNGFNLNRYVERYSEQVDYENFDSKLPKLHKVKELLLRQKVLLNSKELLANKNFDFARVENTLWLGATYKNIWVYETGKPEKKDSKGEIRILRNVFTNYKDYEIAKSYYEDAYSEAKKRDYYFLAYDAANGLADFNYILDANLGRDINFVELYGGYGNYNIYSFRLDESHTNRIRSAAYFEEASVLAEKSKNYLDSIDLLHQAAMTYPKEGNPKERKRIFDSLLQKINSVSKDDKLSQKKIYLIKMDIGIAFIEETGTQKEVLYYYKNIIEDKRFQKEFIKEHYFYGRDNPRDRLGQYFNSERNFCEAAKWEKDNIEYTQLFSKEKPDSNGLERYNRKCNLIKGIDKYNPKESEDVSMVEAYFKNRFYDLADVFTFGFGISFGAQASFGPLSVGAGAYEDKFYAENRSKKQFTFLLGYGTDSPIHSYEDIREGWFRKGINRNKTFFKGEPFPLAEYGRISANLGLLFGIDFEFNIFEAFDLFTGIFGYDLLNDDLKNKGFDRQKYFENFTLNQLNNSLLVACYQGNLEKAKDAIAKGANINAEIDRGIGPKAKDDFEFYPDTNALSIAVGQRHLSIVEYLLLNGADPNTSVKGVRSPLYWAIINNDSNIAKLFIKHKLDVNSGLLLSALFEERIEILKLFLKNGADINSKDENGDTALILAVENANLKVINLLIKNKADLNVRNKKNKSALDVATANNSTEIIKYLISKGAKK